jgi:1-deoxy-D-xylulose-5-phosphate synthase
MPSGSSLKFMMDALPERAFDVGIAEQHAVTLSAGMATKVWLFFATSTPLLQRV